VIKKLLFFAAKEFSSKSVAMATKRQKAQRLKKQATKTANF